MTRQPGRLPLTPQARHDPLHLIFVTALHDLTQRDQGLG